MDSAGILVTVFTAIGIAAIASCEGDTDEDEPRPVDPQVIAIDPADRSVGAVVSTNVTATFDRDMDGSTINAQSFTLTGPSGDLSGSVSYDAGSRQARFNPIDDLELQTSYTAELSTSILDAAGEPLSSAFTWTFTTSALLDRATVRNDGSQADAASFRAAISGDGRFVAFDSIADNLISDDRNLLSDVFRKDMQNGGLVRASEDEDGNGGNGQSFFADLSGNSRYVVFESDATNLIAADNNLARDVFVKDVETGEVERISESESGVAGNGSSLRASITPDGRYVVFESDADNLVPGDINGRRDIFRQDRNSGEVVLVSVTDGGAPGDGNSAGASISDDGRFVAFFSGATNLVLNDTNFFLDVFVKDLDDGSIERVSTSASGVQGNGNSQNPRISGDGNYVVFSSFARNLLGGDLGTAASQIYRKSLDDGSIVLISASESGQVGNDNSATPSLSRDGGWVVFTSFATNMVGLPQPASVSQAYVKDPDEGRIEMLSVVSGTTVGNGDSAAAVISADGRYAAFESDANNLVADDTNFARDIFRAFNSLF